MARKRARSAETIQKEIEAAEAKRQASLDKAKKQSKEIRQLRRENQRSLRNLETHAKYFYGGMIFEAFALNYTHLDPDKFREFLFDDVTLEQLNSHCVMDVPLDAPEYDDLIKDREQKIKKTNKSKSKDSESEDVDNEPEFDDPDQCEGYQSQAPYGCY